MDAQSGAADALTAKPFESRRRARDEKREAVLQTAVQLFLEQGYHRTSLNDVAKRLKITKPALYNYFRSKEEILFECYVIGQERVEVTIAGIDNEGGSGIARLRMLVRAYAALMADAFGASLVRFDARDLSDKSQKIVRAGKRRIDRAFRAYIADGIADGSIERCDPKMASFAIAGSLNWIGHWFKPGGALSAEAIADEFSARLTEGLATRARKRQRTQKKGATPQVNEVIKRGKR